jgi:hypothetical protein
MAGKAPHRNEDSSSFDGIASGHQEFPPARHTALLTQLIRRDPDGIWLRACLRAVTAERLRVPDGDRRCDNEHRKGDQD